MKFKDIIKNSICRGDFISNEIMYNNKGKIPVFSATTTGAVGFYKYSNYKFKKNSFLISLNGNAGFVSYIKDSTEIWIGSDCGVVEVIDSIINNYPKELIALWLQDFCVKNRHVNGTQPKFAIDRNYEKEIDIDFLQKLSSINLDDFNCENDIQKEIFEKYKNITKIDFSSKIKLQEFIDGYIERGKRLVKGRELYFEKGNIKAISSTTSGPMGYYSKSNYNFTNNDFIYSIDGANAGYISIYKPQNLFITDHAGVITVRNFYVKKYGKLAIALFLQNYFTKAASKGTQPTFLLKNNLKMHIDLSVLEKIAEFVNDDFLN